MDNSNPERREKLPLQTYLTYAAPQTAIAFLVAPLGIVQGIYAKNFGLSLTTIASVLLIARVFDALSDPLIGFLSDTHRARGGSRKPFVCFGAILMIIAAYQLYTPIDATILLNNSADHQYQVDQGYFLIWFLIFYLGFTVFDIPHQAWASELTKSAAENALIFTYRSAFGWVGVLGFYLIPLLSIFQTSEFTPHTLFWAVVASSLLLLPGLLICILLTPNGVYHSARRHSSAGFHTAIRAFIRNKPFLLFISAYALAAAATTGMNFTMLFIFVDVFLEQGEEFPIASIAGLLFGLVMIAVWYFISARIGKKTAMVSGLVVYGISLFAMGWLTPENTNTPILFVLLILIYGVAGTALNAVGPALLADIVDYSTLKYRQARSASYFALFLFVLKASSALGGAFALGIAGHFRFDPSSGVVTDHNVFGIRLVVSWLPALILTAATFLFLLQPIDNKRTSIIQRRLEKLAMLKPVAN